MDENLNETDWDIKHRNPERIDAILAKIREVWIMVPHWRLGQLIVNASDTKEPCPIFGLGDSELQLRLDHLASCLKQRTTPPSNT